MLVNSANRKYDKILQSAIEIISEKGLEKTSISDIAKKANVAQGTFYLYFRSKHALIPAIAENLLQLLLKKIKNRSNGKEDFWEILYIIIDETFETTKEYKEVLVLCYGGLAFGYSMETWEAIYSPYYQWFENVLSKAINNNQIVQINVEWHAKMMINLIENVAERLYIAKDHGNTLEETKQELFHFLKRSLTHNPS